MQLIKIMPLNTCPPPKIGLPWEFEKWGCRRAIRAYPSQHRSTMSPPGFRAVNHALQQGQTGPDPTCTMVTALGQGRSQAAGFGSIRSRTVPGSVSQSKSQRTLPCVNPNTARPMSCEARERLMKASRRARRRVLHFAHRYPRWTPRRNKPKERRSVVRGGAFIRSIASGRQLSDAVNALIRWVSR